MKLKYYEKAYGAIPKDVQIWKAKVGVGPLYMPVGKGLQVGDTVLVYFAEQGVVRNAEMTGDGDYHWGWSAEWFDSFRPVGTYSNERSAE